MREELLNYYERELTFIRQMGAQFAEKYPKIASRLQLEPDRCEDPHVERLLSQVQGRGVWHPDVLADAVEAERLAGDARGEGGPVQERAGVAVHRDRIGGALVRHRREEDPTA